MPYYDAPINRYINPFYLEVHPDVRAELEARAGAYGANIRSTNTNSISWPYQKMPWAFVTAKWTENGESKEFRLGFEEEKLGALNSDANGNLTLYGSQRNQPKYPLLTGLDISNQGLRGSLLKGKFTFVFFPELTDQGFELETIQRSLFTPGVEVQISFGWSVFADNVNVNKLEFTGVIYGFSWSLNPNMSISAEVDVVSATTIALGLSGDQTVLDTPETDIVMIKEWDTAFNGINLLTVIDKDLAVVSRSLDRAKVDYIPLKDTPSKLLDYFAIGLPSSEVEETEQIVYNDYSTTTDGSGGDTTGEAAPTDDNGNLLDKAKDWVMGKKNEANKNQINEENFAADYRDQEKRQSKFIDNGPIISNGGTVDIGDVVVGTTGVIKLKKPKSARTDKRQFKVIYEVVGTQGEWDNPGRFTPISKQTHYFKVWDKDAKGNKFDGNNTIKNNGAKVTWNGYRVLDNAGEAINFKFNPDKLNLIREYDDYILIAFMPRAKGKFDAYFTVRIEEFDLEDEKGDSGFQSGMSIFSGGEKVRTVPNKNDKRTYVTMKVIGTGIVKRKEDNQFGKVAIKKSKSLKIQYVHDKKDQYYSVIEPTPDRAAGRSPAYEIVGENASAFRIDKFVNNTATYRKETVEPDVFTVSFNPLKPGKKNASIKIKILDYFRTGKKDAQGNAINEFVTTRFEYIPLKGEGVGNAAEANSVEPGVKTELPATSATAPQAGTTGNIATPTDTAATTTGASGTSPTGASGTSPAGASGTSPAGASGTSPAGASGTSPAGASGTSPTTVETATPASTPPAEVSGEQQAPVVVRDKTFWYIRLGSLVEFANILLEKFEEKNQEKNLFSSLFDIQAFNNETQYNPMIKSANPIDVFFPDEKMGAYGNIIPFSNNTDTPEAIQRGENQQYLRQFARWDEKLQKPVQVIEKDVINIGNILVGVDVIKRIYSLFIEDGGKNIALKNITKFFDDIIGVITAACGDTYEFTAVLFDEPDRLTNSPFYYGFNDDSRRRAILSIEDTNLASKALLRDGQNEIIPYKFDATVIKPLLKNVNIVSRPPKEMAAAAYIAARGGTSLLNGGKGAGLVNLDAQINLGGSQNSDEYATEYLKVVAQLKTDEVLFASSGWNSKWSESYRGNLVKLKRLSYGVPSKSDGYNDAHWLNKAIYPIEFSFTIDGINGFKVGDVIKTSLIPKHYNLDWDITFTLSKLTHKVTPSTWETNISTQARLTRGAPGYMGETKGGY